MSVKLAREYGQTAVRALNKALVLKLKEEKVVRATKPRLEITVIEADTHYPTDTSLYRGGTRLTTLLGRIYAERVGLSQSLRLLRSHQATHKVLRFAVKLDSQYP